MLEEVQSSKITVLGAGAWGTALAIHLALHHSNICLWTHSNKNAEEMNQHRVNQRYLQNAVFPDALEVTSDLKYALSECEALLVVVPSHVFREVLQQVKEVGVSEQVHLAWATKGFESGTLLTLHQVVQQVLGSEQKLAVLSGPTFADEVANGLPTAMVSASEDMSEADYWAKLFHHGLFRIYTQTDVVGVEVGGAYKNIMAIATGVSDGLSLGANARAALISRGMAEMMRLSQALGGQAETMMGLAGLGDLVLTCTDDQSRNRRFGYRLAQSGLSVEEVVAEIGQVVEGVKAARSVNEIAQSLQLDLPIMQQVYALIEGQTTPGKAVQALLNRGGKAELN
jgi:glycerol-3-phosphate dehydrogenase (NAD(P)+)